MKETASSNITSKCNIIHKWQRNMHLAKLIKEVIGKEKGKKRVRVEQQKRGCRITGVCDCHPRHQDLKPLLF